ncbi:uncharacterized protein LOC110982902 [Acanthaster planci]|uniref:Uncharacterized protein LOC110982902 n=1 Tax=Acanthaster planci TaxID=133434 RepID=A0A8B7YVM1_ACAPL|nr:uncharacterized protein LOC110982902 [Acanthaster planci]XP_022097364.1 uncharacterized protein LOC110982902 [Acanthaster planci]
MMLHGSKLSDSPVVDGRQKDVFLPPISTHRKCAGVNNCAPSEGSDDEDTAKSSQFLSTRWRAKPPKGQSRLEVNQSSMSDSFVLPRINGSSSQSKAEHHDRKSRTSLSLPSRTRDPCLTLSKSCPALMSNPRRRTLGGDSPDAKYEYDDDFDESDNLRDIKSVSLNADTVTARKRDGSQSGNHSGSSVHPEDITDGVVHKLAKLESPRSKNSHHGSHYHHHHQQQPPKTKEPDTTLPDIFVPNGLALRITQNTQQTTHGQRGESKKRLAKRQSSVERRSEQDYLVPGLVDFTSGLNDNLCALDPSPWQTSATEEAGTPSVTDPTGNLSTLSHHPSTKGSKKKRKQKKQVSLEQDRPHLLRDTTQADIKCMTWLTEGHQEETTDQLAPPAAEPRVN